MLKCKPDNNQFCEACIHECSKYAIFLTEKPVTALR